jgi:hypothetical protein
LAGRTRGGNSSGLMIAGSVEGFSAENRLPNLNATNAGLLALAPIFNDHLMPVNEVSAAKGAKKDIYLALREFTYQLAEGRDLLRHPSWNKSETQCTPFTCIFLFSSEHTPDVWAARHGELRDPGEVPRLIGVPAYSPGDFTMFDHPPDGLQDEQLRDWERDQFRKIRARVQRHRGAAMVRYAEYLIKHRKGLAKRTRALVRNFERKVMRDDMSPEAQQIVTNFGVLFAGNVLAIDAGLLPFKEARVGSALKSCLERVLTNLPDPSATLRSGQKKLKNKLRGLPRPSPSSRPGGKTLSHADGWRRSDKRGSTYTVRANRLLAWLRDPLTRRLVLEWLDEQGFLEHDKRSGRRPGSGLEWAERQPLWPDGSRPRSIVVKLPNGVWDLRL